MNQSRIPFWLLVAVLLVVSAATADALTTLVPESPSSDTLRAVSLAIEPGDTAAVALVTGRGELKVLRRTGAEWSAQALDSAVDPVHDMVLRANSAGELVLVYLAGTPTQLRLASRIAGAWTVESLPLPTVPLGPLAMCLDMDGAPQIAITLSDGIYYVRKSAAAWLADTIPGYPSGGHGHHVAIDVEPSGTVHLVFGDTGQALEAIFQGGNWTIDSADDGNSPVEFGPNSLVRDGAGQLHLVHYDPVHGDVRQHTAGRPNWSHRVLEILDDVGADPNVVARPTGGLMAAWIDRTARRIKLATLDGEGWASEPLDSGVPVDAPLSLALDSRGNPHLAFASLGENDVPVVTYVRLDSLPPLLARGFVAEVVESTQVVAGFASVFDHSGRMLIAYGQPTDGTLHFREPIPTGWSDAVVASVPYVPSLCLAVDSEDRVHLAYSIVSTGVHYARRDSAGWHFEQVDSLPGQGLGRGGLALDALGVPRVAYRDPSGVAWIATRGETGWIRTSVPVPVPSDVALAVGRDGWSRLAWAESYARDSATGWENSVVLPGAGNGEPALALDDNDQPYVANMVAAPGQFLDSALGLAWQDGSGWNQELVDGYLPQGVCLAVDHAGNPRLVWMRGGGDDALFAVRDQGAWSRVMFGPRSSGALLAPLNDEADRMHLLYLDENLHLVYKRPAAPALALGRVTDGPGPSAGVAGARVLLESAGNAVDSTRTDLDGVYTLAIPTVGDFVVTARSANGSVASGETAIRVDRPGQGARVDFALAPDVVSVPVSTRGEGIFGLRAAPNPFTRATSIEFSLGHPRQVSLSLFDLAGRRVARLFEGVAGAGPHTMSWNGRSTDGRMLPTGVFVLVLDSGAQRLTRKIVLLH